MTDTNQIFKPWSEQEIVVHTDHPYAAHLTKDEPMSFDKVEAFYDLYMHHKDAKHAVKRLLLEMESDSSKLRNYIRSKDPVLCAFDRPVNMNMNLLCLRVVLKDYEREVGDKSNGWYSSTPLNILFFFQLHSITNKKPWTVKQVSKPGSKHPGPSVTMNRSHSSSSSSNETAVVYMIINHNELNALGQPKRYIGRTTNLRKRLRQHQSPASGCRLLKNAMEKYGFYGSAAYMAMTYQVLVAGSVEDMKTCETSYIQVYGTIAPYGYNMKVGDTMGFETSSIVVQPDVVKFDELPLKLQITSQSMVLDEITSFLSAETTPTSQSLLM